MIDCGFGGASTPHLHVKVCVCVYGFIYVCEILG